eukprot:CAMPEP_0181196420 /NCGR_PEP_ID=MMETSP1096-20121128/15457_1 /TAXON_ID=156174 ORGANISM="Chrysochromulina ericina, Strain CCMP281" /NCGR_SAMPLE_ID=MMETSP1096 /ASSEMBLY_ACC=CAM_ASM_000453 /LENGTH=157 /DNA_ID=CAMNT_0023286181 /DNA_START=215 /DNA_END=688 /DNA_ORIENTATION=+
MCPSLYRCCQGTADKTAEVAAESVLQGFASPPGSARGLRRSDSHFSTPPPSARGLKKAAELSPDLQPFSLPSTASPAAKEMELSTDTAAAPVGSGPAPDTCDAEHGLSVGVHADLPPDLEAKMDATSSVAPSDNFARSDSSVPLRQGSTSSTYGSDI